MMSLTQIHASNLETFKNKFTSYQICKPKNVPTCRLYMCKAFMPNFHLYAISIYLNSKHESRRSVS